MKVAAAVAVAGVMFVSACVYGQESLSGRYTGSFFVTISRGTHPVGLTLVIDSVEGRVVKATATSNAPRCGGNFPMEGKFEDNKLQLRSTAKGGAAGDCSLWLNLSVEGNKLVGTTGSGNAVELSR